jgi:hypothetical protein
MDRTMAQRTPSSDRGLTPLRELRGVVVRITYQNPENGYTVARLTPERAGLDAEVARGDDRLVTVVGTLADLTPGEAIVAHGWWRNDPKHGWQFQARGYRTTLPATLQGMRKYLGSGLIKGVGPVTAARIVEALGEATFTVIDADPTRLRAVPGIGPIRAQRIAATWIEQRHIREVMAALQGFGLSTSLAVRIYKRFGDQSGAILTQAPYRLAREVWGIGFKTADTMARAVGIALDAPERIQAGVLHALGEAADQGHTLLPEEDLLVQAADLLGVEVAGVRAALAVLQRTGEVVAATRDGAIGRGMALDPFARAESGVAARLHALAEAGDRTRGTVLRRGGLGGSVRLARRTSGAAPRACAGGRRADGADLPRLHPHRRARHRQDPHTPCAVGPRPGQRAAVRTGGPNRARRQTHGGGHRPSGGDPASGLGTPPRRAGRSGVGPSPGRRPRGRG